MKKKHAIILVVVITLLVWSYFQLFYAPEIIEADYLSIDKQFTQHTNEVWSARFSPNDSLIVSGGYDENAIIWSGNDQQVLHRLKHPYGTPTVNFSPKGNTVSTGSYDGKCRIWDVKTGELLRVLHGHEGTLWSVAYHPSGNLLAGGGEDDKVTIVS